MRVVIPSVQDLGLSTPLTLKDWPASKHQHRYARQLSADSLTVPASLRKRAHTTAGAEYLTKLLYPPSDVRPAGVPDGSQGYSVVVDQRLECVLQMPLYLGTPCFAGPNYSVCVFCPPGNNTMCIVAYGIAGIDFRTARLFEPGQDTLPLHDGIVVVQSYAYEANPVDGLLAGHLCCTSYVPVTATPEPPSNAFVSRTVSAKAPVLSAPPPQLYDGPPPNRLFASSMNKAEFVSFRTVASSITVTHNAPALEQQGFCHVWTGSIDGRPSRPVELANVGLIASLTQQPPSIPEERPFNNTFVRAAAIPTVMRLPFAETEFAKMRPNPYRVKAPQGYFAIHFPDSPEPEWRERCALYNSVTVQADSTNFYWNEYAASSLKLNFAATGQVVDTISVPPLPTVPWAMTSGAYACEAPWDTSPAPIAIPPATHLVPWLSTYFGPQLKEQFTPGSEDFAVPVDMAYDTFQASVAIFRDISINSELSVKRILTVEARLTNTSPLSALAIRPPILDVGAMSARLLLTRCVPAIYPASQNDLSSVLKWASKIAGFVGEVAGAVSTVIPEVAPIAVIAEGVGAATSVLSRLTHRDASAPPKQTPRPKPKAKQKAKVVLGPRATGVVVKARKR